MTAYATVEQFEAYVPGWVTDDADALEQLLERATRDIDTVMGAWPIVLTGNFAGFKIDPAALAPWEAKALALATCAQTEYIWTVDEARAKRAAAAATNEGKGAVTREKGPDFEVQYAGAGDPVAQVTTGGTGRLGPRVAGELAPISHLRRLTGRARP